MLFDSQNSPTTQCTNWSLCASQHAQKVITLSIFGWHHCHSPFSLYSPTRSQKRTVKSAEAWQGSIVWAFHETNLITAVTDREQKMLILDVWPWPYSNPCLIQLNILLAFLATCGVTWLRNGELKCGTELDNIAKINYLLLAIPASMKGSNDGPALLCVLHGPASSESSLHLVVWVPYVAVSIPKDFLRDWIVTPVSDPQPGASRSLFVLPLPFDLCDLVDPARM